ncbi:ribonuclease H-like protein [Viridothelium virens]|uniref:ribonuclease H n=1 Tax=Viridothelium virens TaxID=1048519 RepID=A0A6A6HBB6_VIRVR|nr:ribonuclease H-like protein [Viridothelium virens]
MRQLCYRTAESEDHFDTARWSELQSRGFRTREHWQHQRDYKQWLKHWDYDPNHDDPEDLLYQPGDGYTYERCLYASSQCGTCQRLGYHDQAIVVSIDGACRGNGTRYATAAYGVYFASNSPYSFAEESSECNPTNQKAELEAAIEALRFIRDMWRSEQDWDIERVIIKADSEYVVKSMTSWVDKWNENGYINCKGLPVTNAELFDTLDDLIRELNQEGVGVQFWHVPRRFNTCADEWANGALDEAEGLDVDWP